MCEHPAPGRVLIIGGGLTGVVRNILQHDVKTIDYIELDAEIVKLLLPVLSLNDRRILEDQRVQIIYEDGRKFVKNSSNKYDLILVNTPEPSTAALNRFYTREFLQEIRRIIADDGIMVIGITASSIYLGDIILPYAGSLYKSLQQVFPFILVMPQEDKCYFFAALQQNLFTANPDVLEKRYRERKIYSPSFSAELFQVLVQKERIKFVTDALGNQRDVPINTDFKPITYFYNLRLWETVTAGKGGLIIFRHLKKNAVAWFVFLLGIFCFIRIVWMRKKKSKEMVLFNSLWAIGTTGCAGMALEIVLIFTFQNMYGYIYQMIGIIAASFMLGLTLGGYWINRKIKRKNWEGMQILVIFEVMLCIYSIILPYLVQFINLPGNFFIEHKVAAIVPYLYMLLVFAAGFITGLEFPLVSYTLIGSGYNSTAVAGWVDSIDHLGACAGSIFTGTILMPLVGVYETCFIVGLLKVSSCIFLLFTPAKK
jgi:spermidine synthase